LSDLAVQGNAEQVLRAPNALPDQRACAFLLLGRVEEAAALEFPNAWFVQGREALALERARRPLERYEALLHLLLTAFRNKDLVSYADYMGRSRRCQRPNASSTGTAATRSPNASSNSESARCSKLAKGARIISRSDSSKRGTAA
jgi:hypothetical protein